MMNCNKANKLIMEYIDCNISPEDEFLLKNHLKICSECQESFKFYTEILEEFSLNNKTIIQAPEDFEKNVMKKIENIEPKYIKEKNNKKLITFVFLFMASLTFSIFLMISLNKDVFLENPEKMPVLRAYYYFFDKIFNISLENFSLTYIINSLYDILPHIIESLKCTSLLMLICILIAQYISNKRKNYNL